MPALSRENAVETAVRVTSDQWQSRSGTIATIPWTDDTMTCASTYWRLRPHAVANKRPNVIRNMQGWLASRGSLNSQPRYLNAWRAAPLFLKAKPA